MNVNKLYRFSDSSVDALDGVFEIFIGEFGGFIEGTLGCRTQYHLEGQNMVFKHLIVLFIILMGVNGSSDSAQHPYTLISKSFIIWGVLLMFNRMRIFSTSIVVCLFVILYMVKALREHNKKSFKDFDKKIEEGKPISTQYADKVKMESWDSALLNTERGLMLGIIANVLVGCGLYMNDKKREYGYDFSYKTFFLGIQPCKPLT